MLPVNRAFYVGMALALAITVAVGFGPTYFVRPLFHPTPLPRLAQVHGVLFVSWIVLLLAQTTLVAAHRTDLHRRFGVAGIVLGVAMLPAGALLALESARSGLSPGALDPVTFLAVPLGALAMFAAFLAAAIWTRRRPAFHKRLMLLATISIVTPAIARLWFVGQRPVIALALTNLFVVAAIVHDVRRDRRVHPVYIWGGLVLLLSGPVRIAIGRTSLWHSFAGWLIG